METYIDRIKKRKSEKRLTNEQLADLSGIPRGTLSKILAGMSESPKLSNIVAICDALDCSVEYIVTGELENTNNYTLSAEEISFVESYRRLDDWGRDLVRVVLAKAEARGQESVPAVEPADEAAPRKLRAIPTGKRYLGERVSGKRIPLDLYELPVSAGVGMYLDSSKAEAITVPLNDKTESADYALRISGNSMEPRYHNGDVLLVETVDHLEIGELGIFLLDGSAFFKVYDGDRLLSLNEEYGPILLKDFSDVQCKGRVIGRLRRK